MSKYDLEAIRTKTLQTHAVPDFTDWDNDDPYGWNIRHLNDYFRSLNPPIGEALAQDLYRTLRAQYRGSGKGVQYGNSFNLAWDQMYSWGSIDLPDPDLEVHEFYVRLWHPKRKWPIWVFFTSDGIEFCKTSRERKGMIFAMKAFLRWGWEDPKIFDDVNRWLAKIGFPTEWTPDAEVRS